MSRLSLSASEALLIWIGEGINETLAGQLVEQRVRSIFPVHWVKCSMKIINTRPNPLQSIGLVGKIIDLPLFQYVVISSLSNWLAEIELEKKKWLVFTSANGVRFAVPALREVGGISQPPLLVATVGLATTSAARDAGLHVDLTATSGHAEGLARELVEYQRVKGGPREALLLRAKTATVDLPVILRQAGWTVEEVPVYQSLPREIPSDLEGQIRQLDEAIVLLTSSETAKRFVQLFEPSKFHAVVIGPKTYETVKDMGFQIIRQAAEPTETALLAEAKNLNDSLESS